MKSETENSNEIDELSDKISGLKTQDAKHNNLQETQSDVKLIRIHDDEPVLSVTTFEELNLHPDVQKGVYEMGFTRPSKIQAKALPLLLRPQNMIGQSQSGTGKTAAFVLTMLSRIDLNLKAPQALCLAPSRELARQIMVEARKMGKYTPVTTAEAIRDSSNNNRDRNTIFKEAQLIVGTPGTVLDLIKRHIIDKKNIKIFVLDEADNMLNQQGLGDQSIKVKNLMPKDCQIVLFSATYEDSVREFAGRFAPHANEFRLKIEEMSVKNIKQFYMDCTDEEHKLKVLSELYSILTIHQSIIFVERRDSADRIAKRMTDLGHKVIDLHGGLSTTERDEVMDGFRKGSAKVLISTNVIARGIDVMQVNLVINFDIPVKRNEDNKIVADPDTYLHRIGRTGRFGRKGIAINLVSDNYSWKNLRSIQEYFERDITQIKLDDWDHVETFLKNEIKALDAA
ncbi:328_t:CDS:2 [Diversispora eburnea]|uniref:RNA helicase n=1 Tax=Diversispora eburnea TaxID=1213867 RepID=A0A9N8ZX79_9GLOM|nr:328_t:CDS:2 [Diversispora eburnea]